MSKVAKPVIFLGSSAKDLAKLPVSVKDAFAHGIKVASLGGIHLNAKPLKGYHGRGVLELIEDHRGDTYRGVYTVKFKDVIYVLHVFKKKSTSGISTPKRDKELINSRLKIAAIHHKEIRK